jgi:hypothetical protein
MQRHHQAFQPSAKVNAGLGEGERAQGTTTKDSNRARKQTRCWECVGEGEWAHGATTKDPDQANAAPGVRERGRAGTAAPGVRGRG